MSRTGSLLIAHPNLSVGTPFYRSVIYIYNDDESGTLGLIVNKPTKFTFSQLAESKGYEYPLTRDFIRIGGPVNEKAMFILHTNDWRSTNTIKIAENISISSDDFMIEKIGVGSQPCFWRIMGGVCAWQPGQLDAELKGIPPFRPENSWLTARANDSILFEYDGERQWEKAVELSSQQMINSYF